MLKNINFIHSLSFLTLKYEIFSGISGYRKWSKPLPSHNFNLCLCPRKKFGKISGLGRPWWSAPILSLKKKTRQYKLYSFTLRIGERGAQSSFCRIQKCCRSSPIKLAHHLLHWTKMRTRREETGIDKLSARGLTGCQITITPKKSLTRGQITNSPKKGTWCIQ